MLDSAGEGCGTSRYGDNAAFQLQQPRRNDFQTEDDLCLGRHATRRARGLLECGNGRAQAVYTAAIHGRAWWRTGWPSVRGPVRRQSLVLSRRPAGDWTRELEAQHRRSDAAARDLPIKDNERK